MTGRAEPLSEILFEEMRCVCKEELVKKIPPLGRLGDEYRALYETTLRPLAKARATLDCVRYPPIQLY